VTFFGPIVSLSVISLIFVLNKDLEHYLEELSNILFISTCVLTILSMICCFVLQMPGEKFEGKLQKYLDGWNLERFAGSGVVLKAGENGDWIELRVVEEEGSVDDVVGAPSFSLSAKGHGDGYAKSNDVET
jgi:hypothetical protein